MQAISTLVFEVTNPAVVESMLMLSITTYLISESKPSISTMYLLWTNKPFSMSLTSSWTRRDGVFFRNSAVWTTTVILTTLILGQGNGVRCSGSTVRGSRGGWEIRLGETHTRSVCRNPSARSDRGQAVHKQLPPGRDRSTGEPRLRPRAVIIPGPILHLWEPRSDGSDASSFKYILVCKQSPESLEVMYNQPVSQVDNVIPWRVFVVNQYSETRVKLS